MEKIASIISNGGVGVLATDTLYGLVGKALDKAAVNRIYDLKKRRPDKPFIILVSDYNQLKLFGIKLSEKLKEQLDEYWPGPVSIILPCNQPQLKYLHRGLNSLAFRMPAKKSLNKLLKITGPLVAPSANYEGEPPASSIIEAKNYFGNNVDFYSFGKTSKSASSLIQITDDKVIVLRK